MSSGRTAGNPRSAASLPVSPARTYALVAMCGVVLAFIMLTLYWSGRQRELPSDVYGRRKGNNATDSVNGTSVLARMFEANGSRVYSITELNPRIDKYNVIVWAPDNYDVPGHKVTTYFDHWLMTGEHTLIYIGRDFNAAPLYWEKMQSRAPANEIADYERRWSFVRARTDVARSVLPEKSPTEWFTVLGREPWRRIDSLDGKWSAGIDVAKTEIDLAARLDLPDEKQETEFTGQTHEILLQSENDVLAFAVRRSHWGRSRIIVLANGSFTLNMPLANPEHRKLAAKLIAECPSGGKVAFLESGPGDPAVRKTEESSSQHALHIFTIWPINFIFIHLAALGIAVGVLLFPNFGRPKRLPDEERSDFGQHVAALGELLERTKNREYAEIRLKQYQTVARRGTTPPSASNSATSG